LIRSAYGISFPSHIRPQFMATFRNSILKITTVLVAIIFLFGCSRAAKEARFRKRADQYFKAGQTDKAKVEYLNVVRLNNQNLMAFQQLALIWTEQGVPLRAIPFLRRVTQLAPQNVLDRINLAQSFLQIGRLDDARKEATAILQLDSRNYEAILLLAETAKSESDRAFANEQLEKSVEKDSARYHVVKATLALGRGDMGGAADELQQAIALDPKSARAHLILAYIYLARRNPGHAGPEFKSAADLSPPRSLERVTYAQFQAAHGAANEAKAGLLNITQQAPDYIPAWHVLAEIAFSEKKFDEASSFLENVITRDPDNPSGRILQAQISLSKGDPGKAIEVLTRLDGAYPNNPVIKYHLARGYLATKNVSLATATLEQAVGTNPNYKEASLLLGELDVGSGRFQAGAPVLENLLRKHPELAPARALLADAYRGLGRLDDAAQLFRDKIKMTPQDFRSYFLLGVILRQQQKTTEARQCFEKAAELAPDNLSPIDQLVEMDLADKRPDAARRRIQQQLEKKPEPAGAHFLEAKIYMAEQDWDHAEASLQKAIELDPNLTDAYDLLISVYGAANKLQQAVSQLETALGKTPNNPRTLRLAGLVYFKLKDYPKARDAYEKLLALRPLSPDLVPILNDLAFIYSEHLNQLDRAYDLAQKAHTLHPDSTQVQDTLGWIFYKRGEYQKALDLLQLSAKTQPDDSEIQFHLGMASYMMGDADAARLALEQASHATTDFPGKDEAQRRLSFLQQSFDSKTELPTSELEKLLKQQPNDLIVLNRIAEAYKKTGEPAKSAGAYERVLKLNPNLLAADLELARLYAGPLHNPDKALEFAKKGRELAPNDPKTAGLLGNIALQSGNYTWAYSVLQESARQHRDDPAVLHDLALAGYAMGKMTEALQTMQRSLDLAPDGTLSEDARKFLKMTALEQPSADVIEAEPEVQAVLKAEPDYVPALMAKAAIHLQRNEASDASKIYLEILQKYPDFAPAQKRLAAIYAANPAQLTKAYDLAIKARKVLSDDPELARTLAEINFKRNEFSFAIQLFQESAAKRPLSAEDLYFLGMAQLQTKQDRQGRETLKRSLAAGLSGPFAEEAKKRVAEKAPGTL